MAMLAGLNTNAESNCCGRSSEGCAPTVDSGYLFSAAG